VVIDAAYARCLDIARRHYENFPVASRLLPRRLRPHIAAIYAFARIADDFADEGARAPAARLALLDDWQARLDRADGRATPDDSDAGAIFLALGDTIQRFDLGRQPFSDLLSAFRQDVTVTRYETWEDLLDYCRRSANPIGRLVLRVNGYRAEELDTRSDALCTALQLTNFWQDLEVDLRKDRVYVPQVLVRAAGANIEDLRKRRLTPAWRTALEEAARRTRELFAAGRPVADGVRGRLRWELRATWLGGSRILHRLSKAGFDVFKRRPTLGTPDALLIGAQTLAWRPAAATGERTQSSAAQ
jgi:squalene synthase HpnC